ncbi:MAG: copper resistance protein B [Pseudomonadota bacterium]
MSPRNIQFAVAFLLSLVVTLPACAMGTKNNMAGMHMPRTVTAFEIDEMEWRDGSDYAMKAGVWTGTELSRLTLSGEAHRRGQTTTQELTVDIQRAMSPFWDAGLTIRHSDSQNLTGLSLSGTAWYFIHVDSALFWDQDADTFVFDLHAEHELPLSRQWMLVSSLEWERPITGDGHRETEWGFRFVHEQPNRLGFYGGVVFHDESEHREKQVVLGIRYWL